MTLQQLINKANLYYGVDVSTPASFSHDSFEARCLTAYYAITQMKATYTDLSKAMGSDRNELRLMWLYAEGNLGVVNKRREYKAFTNTL